MKRLREKLRARRGASMSEMLMTVLILGLLTAGVASGVNSSHWVLRKSTYVADIQTLSSTLSIALMDELRYAQDINVSENTIFLQATISG